MRLSLWLASLKHLSELYSGVSAARFLRNLSSLQGVSLYKCLTKVTAYAFLGSCLILRDMGGRRARLDIE